MRILLIVILMITMAIPFSWVNFNLYNKGDSPSFYHAIYSIVFIVLWFFLGLLGDRLTNSFVKISTYFWSSGVVLFILSYSIHLLGVFIPIVLVFTGPVYGLNYFYDEGPPIIKALIFMLIPYIMGLLGAFTYRKLRK